jgi:hypothetical protein
MKSEVTIKKDTARDELPVLSDRSQVNRSQIDGFKKSARSPLLRDQSPDEKVLSSRSK